MKIQTHRTVPGKKCLAALISISLLAGLAATAPYAALAATAPALGTAQNFAVLGNTTVTNTGSTIVSGDLGVSPGTTITGFPPGVVVGGSIHAADATALSARSSAATAYTDLSGQSCDFDLTGQDLGGLTLVPGVYCFPGTSAQLTGTVSLDAGGNPNAVWIFQIGSTLTTASSSSVTLINSGQACKVFWQVGSSATLGTNTTFIGTMLAQTSITLNNGSSVSGRALALNGAMTLDSNNIAISACAIPSLSVVKFVQPLSDPVNNSVNPKAIPGSVMLYTIQVDNSGAGVVDNNTLVITDAIPANTALCVTSTCSSPPLAFTCSTTPPCGLTYSYGTAVSYTNLAGGAAPYAYNPVPDVNGFDASVTGVQINPSGQLNGAAGGNNASFSLLFKVRVQ